MKIFSFKSKCFIFVSTIIASCLLQIAVTLSTCHASEAEYGVAVIHDVMVSMRDGVKLSTNIYLPTRNGEIVPEKLPAILRRTPYNKDTAQGVANYYTSRGYAVVFQDTRGRYKSEGGWHWMTDDGKDGYDCCEWIGEQTWSNGIIGMYGGSYEGGTQHAIAMEKAPNLKTIIPVDAVSNMGYASMRNGGAFELRFWNWIFRTSADGSRQSRDPGTRAILQEMKKDKKSYLFNLPLRKGTTPLKLAPEYEDWLVEGMKHGANDEFWAQNNIIDYTDRYKDMPVYFVGGWYDSWGSNTTASYMALSRRKIKGPLYLIMGPWIHGSQGYSAHGQVSFGKDAAISDPLAWRLEWYDHWLKGIDNTVGKSAPFSTPVRIFIMGTGDGRRDTNGKLYHGG